MKLLSAERSDQRMGFQKYELKTRDWNQPVKDYLGRINEIRRANPALLQTNNLRFLPVDDGNVTGFIKEAGDNAVAVAIALSSQPHDFWRHFGDVQIDPGNARRPVRAIENLVTNGRRLRIEPVHDPALLFRCLT